MGVDVAEGIGDLVRVGEPKLNSIDDAPILLIILLGTNDAILVAEILTVPGDGNRTGIVRLQLVNAATFTPDTVMVEAPVTAVILPPHPLVTLAAMTMGDGSVNV